MNVSSMSMQDRLAVVICRAGALLSGDAGRRLAALLSPTALAIMATVMGLWAASHFVSVMPRGGPTRMYSAKVIFTKALDAGRGGTRPNNVARVGRDYYPESRSSSEAFREVVKTFHHERVHQRLTQAFSLLARPALYLKMGAYKRSFILLYRGSGGRDVRSPESRRRQIGRDRGLSLSAER